MERELHVFEEGSSVFWGLIILVCTACGTYLLAGSFVTMDFDFFKLDQLLALGLFLISFRGIFKLSDPLYHFIFYFEDDILVVRIKKGELDIDTIRIPVDEIEGLKFAPHFPRSSNEALFDFSTTYHLMCKRKGHPEYKKLLDLESSSITLKVDDIAKIMRFISNRNRNIVIPQEQAAYFNL